MVNGINTANGTASFGSTIQSSAAEEKDQFLKLLTYQLKSQNPSDPYDTDQFSSQLAQFSELETMTEVRDLIKEQTDSFASLGQVFTNSALPGMIGMNAKVGSNQFQYDGKNAVKIGYELPTHGTDGTLLVKDSAGVTVKTIDLKGLDLTSGSHDIMWDGTNDKGSTLSPDDYSFEVRVANGETAMSGISTHSYGKIDAVRFKTEGTVLMIGGSEVALNDVSDISA
jgi:flagellar basal-body rod modification protein FlgD